MHGPFEQMMREKIAAMATEKANWLDDVLAGLLSNGVRPDEIEVRESLHQLRTQVWVRGEPKYEWLGKFTIK